MRQEWGGSDRHSRLLGIFWKQGSPPSPSNADNCQRSLPQGAPWGLQGPHSLTGLSSEPGCSVELVPSQDASVSTLLRSVESLLLCVDTRSSCFIIQKVFKWMRNLVSLINIFKSQLIGKLQ